MASACPSAAAHINAVCPRQLSFALTSAPCASSVFTAAGTPVRAAVISAVSPSDCAAFGIGAGFQQELQHGGVAVGRRKRQRRNAIAVGRVHVGAGSDEARRL